METVQFYLSSAIGILLIAMPILFLLACVAFLLQLVLDSDKCQHAGHILLCSLTFVAMVTLMFALGLLGVAVLNSTELLFIH